MSTSAEFLGPLASFLASLTWAVGVLGYAKLSETYPAYIINLHRILVGLPAACLILSIMGGWGESLALVNSSKVSWAVVVVLSSYAFGDALFFMATKRLGGPGALAIASVYPLWSALYGATFEGQMLSGTQIAAIVVVVAGVVAVILSGAKNEDLAPGIPRVQEIQTPPRRFLLMPQPWGFVLAILASLCWSMNTIAVSKLGEGMNAVFVNVLRLSIALVLCPLIGVAMNDRASLKLFTWKSFKPFVLVFAVESIMGPIFYVYGLSHSQLAIGAALTSLAPAISVPVAIALGREKFSWLKSAGIVAVVAGIWLMLKA
ncbi:MAG TPA: DMT family transporter [Bdellovibrionota bacterium]|jgi:drug/metabolite transporter (DMT)-like permease|nr:DMT family transporter [Bdellovibrionota bacterium]